MPARLRFRAAPAPAAAAAATASGLVADRLLGANRGPGKPADLTALLVGEHQQPGVDRARQARSLELVDHAAKLDRARDVRGEEDHAAGLAGADRGQQRSRRSETGVGVDDPLAGQLRERQSLHERTEPRPGLMPDRTGRRRGGRRHPRRQHRGGRRHPYRQHRGHAHKSPEHRLRVNHLSGSVRRPALGISNGQPEMTRMRVAGTDTAATGAELLRCRGATAPSRPPIREVKVIHGCDEVVGMGSRGG